MYSEKREKVGYSEKINDPAFSQYLRNTKRWSLYFSVLLAAIAIGGFFIYGESSTEIGNPQATYIGLGIGGMFIVIAILQSIGRNKSKTWDGVVIDKKIECKRRKQYTTHDDYYWKEYEEFKVFIRSNSGKIHTIRVEDDDTVYNYYQVGDKVRHHGGLNSFEKYDKSKDSTIFCNACATMNNISEDTCFRCKCPLLK